MALVQQATETVVASSTSPANVVFPSATTAGNLVVLVCLNMGGTAHSFTCTGFSKDVTPSSSYGYGVTVLSKIESSGTDTYSVAFGGTPGWRVIGYEFDSVAATDYVQAAGFDPDSNPSTGPYAAGAGGISTTTGGPVIVAWAFDRIVTCSGPTGFTGTTVSTYAGATNGYVAYKVETGTLSSYRGQMTADPATHYDGVIVAYEASGGGSSGPRKRQLLLGVG